MKDFFESKTFKIATWSLAILLVISFIFKAGIIVGEMKANFSCRWSDNYHENFGGQGFGPDNMMMGDRDFLNANGAAGKIINIGDSMIDVDDQFGQEKSVLIKDDTFLRFLKNDIKKDDLKVGDHVVVVGEPNSSGQIEAKLIRVLPSPEMIRTPFNK